MNEVRRVARTDAAPASTPYGPHARGDDGQQSGDLLEWCGQSTVQLLNPVCWIGIPLMALGTVLGEELHVLKRDVRRSVSGFSLRPAK